MTLFHGWTIEPDYDLPLRDRWQDECDCDNGKHWNNADPTSGQWVPCDVHGGVND